MTVAPKTAIIAPEDKTAAPKAKIITPNGETPRKRVFAFDRTNFMLLAAGMAVVILGMILMSGSGSTEETFNPDIFSVRRVKVAPAVCLFGYLFMIYGILRKPRN